MKRSAGNILASVIIFGTVMTVFYVLYALFNVFLLVWLLKLEKIQCTCALNWRRSYLIFYVVFSLCVVLLNFTSIKIPYLPTLITILGIIFIIIAIQYVRKLESEYCNCSEAFMRDLLYVISVVYGLVITVGLLLIFINIFLAAKYFRFLRR